MKDTDYAYAAANVRTMETELLSQSFIDQLITADSFENVRQILIDKGFSGFEKTSDASEALADYMTDTWDYLTEIAPDKQALEFLVVRNDFHNLKSVTKGIAASSDGRKNCIKPCLIDIELLYDSVKNKEFENLPKWIADIARDGYELLTSSMDGQIFDMFIDKASLETMIAFAGGNAFSKKLANEIAALTDIKIAYRLSKTSANEVVYKYAFAECEELDAALLAAAAQRGREQVIAYIENTEFAYLAGMKSAASLERECDNRIMEMLDSAKRISFGIEPLIAYYHARMAEWTNLRIIVSAKHAGLPPEAVKERMRDIYV